MPEWLELTIKQVPSLGVLVAVVAMFLRHLANNSVEWGAVVERMNKKSTDVTSDVVKKLDRNTEVTEELMKTLGANTATLERVEKALDRHESK